MAGMPIPPRNATEIGIFVRQLREQRGLTQLQLAVRAGVTDTTVRAVERASKKHHRATLAAIAAALGTTAQKLSACRNDAELNSVQMPGDEFLDWDELP